MNKKRGNGMSIFSKISHIPIIIDTYIGGKIRYYIYKHSNAERYPSFVMKQWKKRGYEPFDFEHPQTYTQKIQVSKIDNSDSRKTLLADKVRVRDWVASKIGNEYLIPIYGVYDNPDSIDFERLPNKFVIKMNHSSGMNIVVEDKSKLNIPEVKKKLKKWFSINYAFVNLEMQYRDIRPLVYIEKYMKDSSGGLRDYKFLCFNGEVKYCWVDFDRFSKKHTRNVYDLDWNLQPWGQRYSNYLGDVPKPKNYDLMISIAQKLCDGFEHVRVDLYNIDGDIYFGEMTFTNGNGMEKIYPDEYDIMLGNMWRV